MGFHALQTVILCPNVKSVCYTNTGARLYPSETLLAHLDFLSRTFQANGLPLALYVDFHSFFYTPNPDAFTQLGTALHFYGVALRDAPTPQAKGKIERRHDYWQARRPHCWWRFASLNSKAPTTCSNNSSPTPTNTKSTANWAPHHTPPGNKRSQKNAPLCVRFRRSWWPFVWSQQTRTRGRRRR